MSSAALRFATLLDRYTQLTGRPELAPRWTMGLHYICRYYETQQGALRIADEFRRRDIPWDMIGLEPGWEEVPYGNRWKWSPPRFPDPKGMISQLAGKGFRFELWEPGRRRRRIIPIWRSVVRGMPSGFPPPLIWASSSSSRTTPTRE